MEIYVNPPQQEWKNLCRRAQKGNAGIAERVAGILERVKRDGDRALRELSIEIDSVELGELEVSQQEISEAANEVTQQVKDAIEVAVRNISAFHKAQMPSETRVETSAGVVCIQKPVPVEKVGLYIPGGTAPLFSTVLMLALPAAIAGCKDVILCTPAGKSGKVAPQVLYAAWRCGVKKIYRTGGAQAIAAMAYGTESIVKRNKIFGPGNRYVTTAKQMVSGENTSIDMPAGPSEVMIMADGSARAQFVAADLLSQAEHGADSQGIVVCNDEALAREIYNETERQASLLERGSFVKESLENSRIIVLKHEEQMIAFANTYAAEHLIISMEKPWEAAGRITSAGSIFIGNWSPESAGDYASGTNHTLPTSGWARSCSGVNMDSFMKKITIQELTPQGIASLAPSIIAMAEAEGLQAHANAVKIRCASM